MTSLLPIIDSRERYYELFKSNLIWEPAIKAICEKHQLDLNVTRSTSGSHIVFKTGGHWIKLMAPIFEKEMLFETAGLKSVAGRLSVKTPEVIAEGIIEGYPYIILTDVPGEPIKYAWPKLQTRDQEQVIRAMAKTIHELALCPASDLVQSRFNWNAFITDQYLNCEVQQIKKQMPEPWLNQLKTFLAKFSLTEFTTDQPIFLHCDLSYDHFFISNSGAVRLTGIIDLADCQYGHAEYELAAPAVFVFKNHRAHLRLFLQECGYKSCDQRFSEKLLAWCLLHRYFGLSSFFKPEMDVCKPGDFSELASRVFPL